MFRLLILTFFVIVGAFSPLKGNDKLFLSRPYFEIATGNEIGVNQSYATLGVITTIPTRFKSSTPRLWLYGDSNWTHFIKGTNGASVEGGFVWGNEDISWNGYVGYDVRRWHHSSFSQIASGLQMSYGCWQIFYNLYCPLQDDVVFCSTRFKYSGGFKATLKDFDATYRIASINISRSFNTCVPCICGAMGIEPYYLRSGSKNICNDIEKSWGAKLRFLLNISETIKLEASISHDKIFHTRAQVVLGIDLLQAYRCSCESTYPLYKSFRRQGLVAIKHRESWKRNWIKDD
jgi:hypothetical protein